MRATLILNPRSGKKRALSVRETARTLAKEFDVDLTEKVIEGPGHGTRLAQEAAAAGADESGGEGVAVDAPVDGD